jgi:hypothetical protein
VAHNRQSRYCAPVSGSFASCGEVAPKLRRAWALLLLVELAEVQDLRFAELGELFLQFWQGLWPLPN